MSAERPFYKRDIKKALYYRVIYNPMWTLLPYFFRTYYRIRIKKVRKQAKIRVLFIVAELGAWKTELLYQKMLNHSRFEPIIGITTSQEVPGSKDVLVNYLNKRGFRFVDLDEKCVDIENIKPDLKFYYKPYEGSYPQGIFFNKHWKSIVCHIHYAANQSSIKHAYTMPIQYSSLFNFVESESIISSHRAIGVYTGNLVATGCPSQDALNLPISSYLDPWKNYGERKRIIYAPHHSFPGTNKGGVEYATFLEFGDFILKMANKYADKVQWAFKPHPTLKRKLNEIWGTERTNAYYKAWELMDNTQYEQGAYDSLFKYSDAMIHDCSSFTVEYHYTKNPVMFLVMGRHRIEDQNEFGQEAYKCHYEGHTEEEIEAFINNVINNVDPLKQRRCDFYKKYLLPPNGQSACDNIIDAILGQGAYKDVK